MQKLLVKVLDVNQVLVRHSNGPPFQMLGIRLGLVVLGLGLDLAAPFGMMALRNGGPESLTNLENQITKLAVEKKLVM